MNERLHKKVPSIPLVKAAFMEQFKVAMENNRVIPEHYFDKVHLPLSELEDPEAYVPEKPFWKLMNQVAIEENIPDFGMQVAQITPWYRVESVAPLIEGKSTLGQLLEAFCKIASSQSNTSGFNMRTQGEYCWFENFGQVLISSDVQMELYRVTSMIDLIRLASGKTWRPAVVHLMMKKNKVATINPILEGCEVVFAQPRTAIAFPSGLLEATININTVKKPSPNIDLDEIHDKSQFINALQEIIKHYISQKNLSIEMLAEIAGLSTRSLQRSLKKFDTSYNDILNAARYEYSQNKLKNPAIKITDIASQLGYNDSAHFTRAFRRWAGISPREYRRQHAA